MKIRLQSDDDPMDRIIEHVDTMMKEMMGQNYFRSSGPDCWRPALNVYDLSDRFVVCVELAGMDRERISLSPQTWTAGHYRSFNGGGDLAFYGFRLARQRAVAQVPGDAGGNRNRRSKTGGLIASSATGKGRDLA